MMRRLAASLVDASSLIGLCVFVTGGYWRRGHGHGVDLDFTSYAPFFWPIALCLVLKLRPGGYVLPLIDRLDAHFSAASPRLAGAWVAVTFGALTAAHGCAVYFRYMSFQAGMDLAIYANACRNGLYSTMKGDVWLFADHFEPLLWVFTPLCRRYDPALVLLWTQELGFGLGALGLYMLARRRGWERGPAWLAGVLYLCFVGSVTVAYYDFHLLSLALGVVPWLWWALEAERYLLAVLFGLLYLGLKENVALSLVGLGAYLVFTGPSKRRWLGFGFALVGAATFLVIMKVVYPLFRHGEETMYFAKYYGHLGKNMGEFVHTLLTRPVYFMSTLFTRPKLDYVLDILAPFVFLPIWQPRFFLPIAPALLVNILSNDVNLLSHAYHYEAEIYPALFAMALLAVGTARLRAVWLASLLVLFTQTSATAVIRRNQPTPAQQRLRAQLEQHVPHDVAVAAPQRIAAHLTRIPRLYMFDYWQMEQDWKRADVVVVGYPGDRLGWYGWNVLEYLKLPRMRPLLRPLYQDPADPNFRVFEVLRAQPQHLTQR
jgi:uncharacterized membrane protein